MKNLLLVFILGFSNSFFAQNSSSNSQGLNIKEAKGTWKIDLKVLPDSPSYFKDFVIKPSKGNEFGGIFYETEFKNGFFNKNWDVLYFAFSTRDYSNEYFHSGYIKDGKIFGITYCPTRKFTSHWAGSKKKK